MTLFVGRIRQPLRNAASPLDQPNLSGISEGYVRLVDGHTSNEERPVVGLLCDDGNRYANTRDEQG